MIVLFLFNKENKTLIRWWANMVACRRFHDFAAAVVLV